jgi:hypothetical protein
MFRISHFMRDLAQASALVPIRPHAPASRPARW